MSDEAFSVSLGTHLMSGTVQHARPLWKMLGNMETAMVRKQLARVPIVKPIYVSGLARSGTTVLIEIIASHPDVATHQYRDFPFLYIPYWWRQTLDRSAPPVEAAAERAHGDRLMVTSQSPEAMEEVLWMGYFKRSLNSHSCDALDTNSSNPKFEQFYREHIQKLLLITKRSRYAAKGNYNLTRLAYLQKMFADARFLLPIRHPRDHIASLMKQHKLFVAAGEKHPRSVAHLDRVGHNEFGIHRRCINPTNNRDAVESIEQLWRDGKEVRGWARYWALLYRWVSDQLRQDERLNAATMTVHYEDLCDAPADMLTKVLAHCALPDPDGAIVSRWAPTLARPTYYAPKYSDDEERAIVEETADVAKAWGY